MKINIQMEMTPKEAHEMMYHPMQDPKTHFETMTRYWNFWNDLASGKIKTDISEKEE